METTVILLKPDCVEKKLVGEVIARLEKAGLRLRACKMMRLSSAVLQEHYNHIAHLPFFPDVASFMQSHPVVALAVEGQNAVTRVRDLVGPTDSTKAPKGSIRGDLGQDKMRNIIHASDSVETAGAELKRFFAPSEVF